MSIKSLWSWWKSLSECNVEISLQSKLYIKRSCGCISTKYARLSNGYSMCRKCYQKLMNEDKPLR